MSCACSSDDAYECWADRYNLGICDAALVEYDGGPCQCVCHNEEYDSNDDEYFYPLDDGEN